MAALVSAASDSPAEAAWRCTPLATSNEKSLVRHSAAPRTASQLVLYSFSTTTCSHVMSDTHSYRLLEADDNHNNDFYHPSSHQRQYQPQADQGHYHRTRHRPQSISIAVSIMTAGVDSTSPLSSASSTSTVPLTQVASETSPLASTLSLTSPSILQHSFSVCRPYSSQSDSRTQVVSPRRWRGSDAAGSPIKPVHIPPLHVPHKQQADVSPISIRPLPALSAKTVAPASRPSSPVSFSSACSSPPGAVSGTAAASIFRTPYVTPHFSTRFLPAASSMSSCSSSATTAASLIGSPVVTKHKARLPPLVARSEMPRQRRLTPTKREWKLSDLTKRRAVRPKEKQCDGEDKLPSLLQRVLLVRDQCTHSTASAAPVSADFAYSPSSTSLPSTLTSPLHTPQSASTSPFSRMLTFRDSSLEASYRADFLSRYFGSLRRAVLLSCCMWLLFVITDVVKWLSGDRPAFVETVVLRVAVALLVVATTSLTFYPPVRRRVTVNVLKAALCAFILMFGACQVEFGVLQGNTLDPTYCTFIILLSSMSASWFRLSCFLSVACNVALGGVFVLMTAVSGRYDSSSSFVAAIVWIGIAIVLFSFHGYGIERASRSNFLAAQQLSEQEQRSQLVLAAMLPLRVISELRTARAFVYERHEHVSVLFSHVHEFDRVTAEMAARQTVELLNNLFSRFDLLTDLLGVYKVETIGDVYLVGGGVPDRLERHACLLALLAVCMMEEMRLLSDSLQDELQHLRLRLRVGLHSGPVVAGVVGLTYPRFRLMGDTVNTASRMSTTCEPSQIQLSRATFQQLSDCFVCRYNGRISVKGKGLMETYLLRYVLPVEGSAGVMPISVDEACGDRTDAEVAAQLGYSLPASSPLHTRADSVPIPTDVGSRLSIVDHRRGPSEMPASPDFIAARNISAPLPSILPTDSTPFYHARPISGRLYSNSLVEANVLSFEADDVQAVLADARSGTSVHRLYRLRTADNHSEIGARKRSFESEEKEQSAVPVAADAYERYTASVASVEFDPMHHRGTGLVVIEPTVLEEQKEVPPSHTFNASGADSGSPLTPQLSDDSAGDVVSSVAGEPHSGVASTTAVSPCSTQSLASSSPSSSPSSLASTVTELPSPIVLPLAPPLSPTESQSDVLPSESPPASSMYTISANAVSVSFLHAVPTLSELRHSNPLRLAFHRHPQLESDFQREWSERMLRVTRRGVATLLVCLMALGGYDTYADWPVDGMHGHWHVLAATWGLRLTALLLGAGVICVSYWRRVWFCQQQQWLVFVCWTLIAMLQSIVGVLLSASTSSYVVTTTLILITSTSFFVGLQFRFVVLSTLLQLLFYVVAEVTQRGDILNAFFLLASAILSMLSAHSAEHFQRLDYIGYLRLRSDEKRTRDIRDQMLPPAVMNDIMKQLLLGGGGAGAVVAHDVSVASVLFCDIVEFTSLAGSVGAEDVVAILNIVFSTFDALTTRHKVYKVETIGDAYLACSGVVQPTSASGTSGAASTLSASSHTENLVKCALDFQSASQYFRTPTNAPISLRIGIHTGHVIAGVVGRKMPRYHLFGETVTLAEEMEHSRLAGSVVISGETHREVGDSFSCRPLTDLLWKGGLLARWKVLHCRTELGVYAGEGGGEGEGGLPSLPSVVSDILYKVHEANVREQEARERRWFGSDGSTKQRADDKQSMHGSDVQVFSSTVEALPDVLSAAIEASKVVKVSSEGRRRSMSESSTLSVSTI